MIEVNFDNTFEGWRDEARKLLKANVAPGHVAWNQQTRALFNDNHLLENPVEPKKELVVPAAFIDLAKSVSYARDEDRWDLLYRVLYRLQHENPNLLKINIDSDIHRCENLRKSVSRDIHKMHAFVRFKKTIVDGEEHYIAWHQSEHLTVKPGTPFFQRRFGDRKWSIYTPDESAHWDLKKLTFGPGMAQSDFKITDEMDDAWKTYYKSIFNPSRIKVKMMKQEMSPKYWSSMPETQLIKDLIREAPQRLQIMAENQNHAAVVDRNLSLSEIRKAAIGCKACPLFSSATQTVFGEGPDDARIMIVGEQPGDKEDLAGRPFQGPAGKLLDELFEELKLYRKEFYLTNAVKHFKWTQLGDMRQHKRASGKEMHACKPWLEAEIHKVKPDVILALGVTAGTMVLGRQPKISEERGKILTGLSVAPNVILSWHPAAILRAFSPEQKVSMRDELFRDLELLKNLQQKAS